MSIPKPTVFVLVLLLLTACTPITATLQSPVPTDISLPTSTSTRTVEDLISIIYMSDPTSPQYNPESPAYAEFPNVLKQISDMGPGGIDTASHVAVAITFPRQDSYLAAQTLLTLGPDITATTIPVLIDDLHDQKPNSRIYAAILLGSVGDRASCAVGDIAPLLWDSDSLVRSSAAIALEKITKKDLVEREFEIVITPSFLANSISPDTPEGKIVGIARNWWNEQGSKVSWHPSYGICDP